MFFLLLFLLAAPSLHGAAVVTNVRAAQIPGTHQVRITYDLAAAVPCTVSVQVWIEGSGAGLDVPATAFAGDIGPNVTPATAKSITLTVAETVAGVTTVKAPALQNTFTKNLRFKILASENFILIAAGNFQMGDQSDPAVGLSDEKPVHTVYVSDFFMAKYETSKELWDSVRVWGMSSEHGYTDLAVGNGGTPSKGVNHPVHSITWYDMVKWCNARSEQDGLTPCYYTDVAQTTASIYKTGRIDIDNTMVKWNANGYRLPTEAEWEKAARGELPGKNFPWGDTISHSQANYIVYSADGTTNYYSYDVTLRPPGTGNIYGHPYYATGSIPHTAPVNSFPPNGYGLYNMTGNLSEWCWDWHGSYSAGLKTNPQGPMLGLGRVLRGGGWGNHARYVRLAVRNHYINPGTSENNSGFRVARNSPP